MNPLRGMSRENIGQQIWRYDVAFCWHSTCSVPCTVASNAGILRACHALVGVMDCVTNTKDVCVMHQSIPAAPIPPPPGNCGAFACLVSPGGGALAKLARPEGRAFAYPRAFDTHVVSDSKSKHEGFYRKGPAVRRRLDRLPRTGQTCGGFLDLCISSLLIKAQLSLNIARSGTINVNRRTHSS